MITYECQCCGETHEGLPDLAFQLPQVIFELDEEERSERCAISSDLCKLDNEHFFVRGLLEIPIIGSSELFAYGPWTTLSRENFELYFDSFDDDIQSGLGPFFGYLSNPIPGYSDSLHLPQEVHLRDHGSRPRFVLHDSDHPLVQVQQRGLTEDEAIRCAEAILHPSSTA